MPHNVKHNENNVVLGTAMPTPADVGLNLDDKD
jgi:hypothetical protein